MVEIANHETRITNDELFSEAKKFIPGGVNSPVRSFQAVGGNPIFVQRALGSKIYGECEQKFTDYCLSWGALILGHAHPEVTQQLEQALKAGTSFGAATKLETELARLIVEAVSSIEQVRLTSSGTEAVMSAIRLARGYTRKNKIIKFAGSYHGHADYLLTQAGSGQATLGIPSSLGVPKEFAAATITVAYNDIKAVQEAVARHHQDLAAIIVEPIAANCGVILPQADFLPELRRLADKYNILLIFDEVITGFRMAYGGAQEYFSVQPDLTCLGKIVGAGMPIGAFGGRRQLMRLLAPEGEVYQAGTLSGNPISCTAGITALKILRQQNPYQELAQKTKYLCQQIKLKAKEAGIKLQVNYSSSIFSIFFTDKAVIDFSEAKTQDTKLFKRFFHSLLKQGIYFSPSAFEANFLSIAHSDTDIAETLNAIGNALHDISGYHLKNRSGINSHVQKKKFKEDEIMKIKDFHNFSAH